MTFDFIYINITIIKVNTNKHEHRKEKMSSKKLRLSKTKRNALIIGGLILSASTVCYAAHQLASNIEGANATKRQIAEKRTGDYIFEEIPQLNLQVESSESPVRSIAGSRDVIGASSLPAQYDSRTLGYISRQENQAGEGLCWAYSFTTAAESYLLKSGLVSKTVELSPKHLDYALAQASEALVDSTVNKYDDYLYSLTGSHHELAEGGNHITTLAVTTGKYSLVEDDTFFSKMKANDPDVLGGFDTYGDFIVNRFELAYDDYLANGATNLPTSYTTKQHAADVFDRNSAEFAVTGSEYIDLGYYSSGTISSEREAAINQVKSNIKEYGAVAVASHYNEEECMYIDGQNYTIIDRTTNSPISVCDGLVAGSSGHGMTLVGWNDNWGYEDNGVEMSGAFIVQNSYGNDGKNYYLSYNSYANTTSITEMQSTQSFEKIYDMSDYTKTVNKDNYEIVFDFTASGTHKLSEIAAFIFPITNSPALGWDIYVSNGDSGQYTKVGRIDDGGELGVYNIKNLNATLEDNFSVKIKYDNAGYTIQGFTPELFNERVAPYITTAVYTGNGGVTPDPDPTPAEDEPNGTVTWVQGQNYTIGSEKDLIVKVDYSVNLLTSVTLDDEALPDGSYKTESGSTVLTIYSSYLDTLDEGTHTIKFAYSNGEIITTQFTVSEEDVAVPSTSGSTTPGQNTAAASPNTGRNTTGSNTVPVATGFAIPAIVILVLSACIFTTRSRHKVKFDRK